MRSKHCSQCDINKPITDYYKQVGYTDGYRGVCKACTVKRGKSYQADYAKQPQEIIKNSARRKLRHSVKKGRTIRPNQCSQCDTECKPQGHHEDYSKPLEVIWLCTKCHGKRHRTVRP